MKFRPRFPILFLVLVSIGLAAEPALKPGESLSFKVGWGWFTHAGEINISAASSPAGVTPPRLKVETTTATRGLAKVAYAFEARAESLYDPVTGRLLSTTETSKSGDRESKFTTTFDHEKRTATYTNVKDPAPVVLTMPAGEPQDLIMSLVQTRRWNLKPGEKQDALIIFGDEFYELTIHAARYEEVKTSMGTFNTLVLEPRMDKTPPKGMFKRGGAVRVWISQDERRLPVKFQVEFKFGAGTAVLNAYDPPGDATPVMSSAPDAKNSRP